MSLYHLFLVLLLLSAVVSLSLVLYTMRRRPVPGAGPFALLLFGAFIWSGGYVFELLAPSLNGKIFWDNIEFVGSDAFSAGALLFALTYTHRIAWVRRAGWLLLLVPFANLLIVWTDPLHHWLRIAVRLDVSGAFPVLAYRFGLWGWFLTGYSAMLFLLSAGLLAGYSMQVHPHYRRQVVAVTLGLVMPCLGTLLSVSGMVPILRMEHLDIAPLTFAIAQPIWAWGVFRQRLFDLAPMAHDSLFVHLPDGVLVLDRQQRVVDANPSAVRLIGGGGKSPIGVLVSALLPEVTSRLDAVQDHPATFTVRRDGRGGRLSVALDVTVSQLTDPQHRYLGWLLVLRDVTAQYQAEAALHESRALLEGFLRHAPASIMVLDDSGRYRIVSNRAVAALGFTSAEEALGKTTAEIFPQIARSADDDLRHILETGELLVREYVLPLDGRSATILSFGFPIRNSEGVANAVGYIATDISDRKRLEEALRVSEARFRAVWERAIDAMVLVDADGTVLMANPAYCQMFGLAPDAVVGLPCTQIFPPHERDSVMKSHRARFHAPPVSYRDEVSIHTPAGVDRFVEVHTSFLLQGEDRVAMLSVLRDITARKRTEQRLREIGRMAKIGGWELDLPSMMVTWTDELYAIHDVAHDYVPTFDRVLSFYPEEAQSDLQQRVELAILQGTPYDVEMPMITATGHQKWVRTQGQIEWRDGTMARMRGTLQDITDRKEVEEARKRLDRKLQETQRLESLGVLAGGIAHDFNNLLQSILGHAELIQLDLPDDSPLRHDVRALISGAQRAADLTSQILAYAGKGRFMVQSIDLNLLIREVHELLRITINKHGGVRFHLAQNLPSIEGDSTQIRQVIMNLLMNAAEAMEHTGGTLTVTTNAELLTRAELAGLMLGDELPAGTYLRLTVTDTGKGMDASVQQRMFDPFFTTKFTGRGLGLAAVQGIIRGHRGTLQVASTPGKGTTFSVWLPVNTAAASLSVPTRAGDLPEERGAVLVIDDEDAVRVVTQRLLERQGYAVRSAADGPAALALLRAGIPDLSLALVDLTMPRMSGDEVTRAINELQPDLPVILMSGYSAEELMKQYSDLSVAGYVQKPFTAETLLAALGAALERARRT